MKVLESKHIYLSTYENRYLEALFSWENNLEELNEWSTRKRVLPRARFKSEVENLTDNNDYDNYFFIINKNNEELIGYVGYTFLDLENGNFIIFMYVKADCRGMPINTEALLIFLNYMFQYYPVIKVESSIFDYNKNSLNNVLSMGFQVEGIRRKHIFYLF